MRISMALSHQLIHIGCSTSRFLAEDELGDESAKLIAYERSLDELAREDGTLALRPFEALALLF